MLSATRSATCLSGSRAQGCRGSRGKYFWARMLVALTLQDSGTSTPAARSDGAVAVVRDARVTALPAHLVVGVDALGGEVPADADPESLGCDAMCSLL